MQTWIHDDVDDPNLAGVMDGISRQIEYFTGLNVRNYNPKYNVKGVSEAYQIVSYRTSHHYDEHLDAVSIFKTK